MGLLVSANSRKLSTWEPFLDLLGRKLNMWGHKYISFGARIVLLNSVLNSGSNFLFVFFEDAGGSVEEVS